MEYRALPIGIDNFETIISKEYYYVDKTELLKKLMDTKALVTLFTRPRRFGKSLNLSMIQHFFELNYELRLEEIKKKMKNAENDNYSFSVKESGEKYLTENPNNSKYAHLFKGLKIMYAGEKYLSNMGRYPVIMLNFKEGKQIDFERAYYSLKRMLANEFSRHDKILDADILSEKETEMYIRLRDEKADMSEYAGSIEFLSTCLKKVYGEKAIILIDEYDVPLENAFFEGPRDIIDEQGRYISLFYKEMLGFMRGILSIALKTNNSLEFAVVTGCLRITKESIFTGINNFDVVSVRTIGYGEFCGFTEEEVKDMLKFYDKSHHMEIVKDWYDGYVFGDTDVYNPWSVLKYVKTSLESDSAYPEPYWANTSSNSIIKDLVERANINTIEELERILEGESIEKVVNEEVTYLDIYDNDANLWNFLCFTGYMKNVKERFDELQGKKYMTLKIPNKEVEYIYETKIMNYVQKKIEMSDMTKLYEATTSGDEQALELELNLILAASISYFDSSEAFYHGIMVGLYNNFKTHRTISNEECGDGRPDLMLLPAMLRDPAIVFEFKISKELRDIEETAEIALKQIEEKQYEKGIIAKGYKSSIAYGISFHRKHCVVRKI